MLTVSIAKRKISLFGLVYKTAPRCQCFGYIRFTARCHADFVDPRRAQSDLLSYAYSLLVRTWTVALSAVGLDPYRGFYHQPRYGRPALALDLMEPFRPIVADSAVIQAINNREVRPTDFVSAAGSVALTNEGRKRLRFPRQNAGTSSMKETSAGTASSSSGLALRCHFGLSRILLWEINPSDGWRILNQISGFGDVL